MGFNTAVTEIFLPCDIGTTVYDCQFAIENESDLVVYKIEIATNTKTLLTFNVDYTLSDIGFDYSPPYTTTVKVTLIVALDNSYKLYIFSNRNYILASQLRTNVASATEDILRDNLEVTRMVQQLNTSTRNYLQFDPADGVSIILPSSTALGFFRWDATGTLIEYILDALDFNTIPTDTITTADWLLFGKASDSNSNQKTLVSDFISDVLNVFVKTVSSGSGIDIDNTDPQNLIANWNINALPAKVTLDGTEEFGIRDAGINKKSTIQDLIDAVPPYGPVDFTTTPTDTPVSGDYALFGDISDGDDNKKATWSDVNAIFAIASCSDYVSVIGALVASVSSGTGINVDNTDPANPIINSDITGLTAKGSFTVTDEVPIYDATGLAIKKITGQDIIDLVPAFVESVSSGTGIDVDNTDPVNPIINSDITGLIAKGSFTATDEVPIYDVTGLAIKKITGQDIIDLVGATSGVASVSSGTGIDVDNTDPANPIINSDITGLTGKGSFTATDEVPIYDATGLAIKKITGQDILDLVPAFVESVSSGTGVTMDNTDPQNPIANIEINALTGKGSFAVTDEVPIYDATGLAIKKITGQDILDLVPAFVESVSSGTGITIDNTDAQNPIANMDINGLSTKGTLVGTEQIAIDTAGTGEKTTLNAVLALGTFQAEQRNFIINPCGCVARRPIYTLVHNVWGFSQCERWKGMAFSEDTVVGGGTLRQGTGGIVSTTGNSIRFASVTLTGATSYILLRYRIESKDAIKLKNQSASLSFAGAHNIGSAITLDIHIEKADALDNFTALTNISSSTGLNFPDAGSKTTFKFENVSMGDCSNGVEIRIQVNCGTIAAKTFEFGEFQFNIGATANMFIYDQTYGEMVEQCNRFYQKSYDDSVTPGTIDSNGSTQLYSNSASSFYYGTHRFVNIMRTAPTLTIYSTGTGTSAKIRDIIAGADKNPSISNVGMTSFYLTGATLTSNNLHGYQFTADADL